MDEPPAPRPLGLTVAALFYIVLGSHALMFAAYFLTVPPEAATPGLAGMLRADAGFVRTYGLALVAIAALNGAIGVGLARGRPWARWLALAAVVPHLLTPPSPLGLVLFDAAMNTYLWGAASAHRWLAPRPSQA